ncbi:MAG: amidohydrolase [Thermoplasmata archaeon]|nr:amidohydrolase [Thermoplasmata archaeon]
MLIDAHIHIWKREMLPDDAIRNYLEPVRKLKELYGDLFDFGLDDEIPFADYDSFKEGLTEMMDCAKLDYAVVLATDFSLVNEGRMTNDEYMQWLYDQCQVDDRLLLFTGVDANHKDAIEKIERYYDSYEPVGMKVYPASGFYPNDPKYEQYWSKIEELGLPVTVHAGMALAPLDEKYCHPNYLSAVAERHPDLKIIVAHLGGKFHDELIPLMQEYENVYTDCSALQGWMPDGKDTIRQRLDEVTSLFPDRVVFGSDFPLYENHTTCSRFIEIIRSLDFGNDSVKDKLLGDNMARLLGL